MRLWSLHPKYLDTKGLVGLWREALLAQRILEGKTQAYINHPQMERFKKAPSPLNSINQYLSEIFFESLRRNYKFSREKINWNFISTKLPLTTSQLDYEVKLLLNKLKLRDKNKFKEILKITKFEPHPLFRLVKGGIETWERIK